jgi:dihydropteroate synthase
MGILNVTPDSFYDGGKYNSLDSALFRAEEMLKDGADIIDVGGESTRPGSDEVSEDDERARVLPVVEKIVSELGAFVSIDTMKSKIADEALAAGARMINDVSGYEYSHDMPSVAAKHNAALVIILFM